jgi:hypothetical protein
MHEQGVNLRTGPADIGQVQLEQVDLIIPIEETEPRRNNRSMSRRRSSATVDIVERVSDKLARGVIDDVEDTLVIWACAWIAFQGAPHPVSVLRNLVKAAVPKRNR